jgi:glycosyltransferase involved in cell wall biosynthesis
MLSKGKKQEGNISRPFVSVLTPTYNRRRFLPSLIECYKAQTYPKDRMEWVVFDDGTDCVKDIFDEAAKTIPNLHYIRHEPVPDKLLIGAKRNRLNKEAKGDILVAMDDDDFYSPERVSHVVFKFAQQPKVELAGSSEIYMYYTDIGVIYKLGPYDKNHATNGTMAWRDTYAKTHTYDETVTHAEERSFLDNYKHPMIQLDPFKVMLVISHTENTFDKKKLRDDPSNPFVQKTGMKLNAFIKSTGLRTFFKEA